MSLENHNADYKRKMFKDINDSIELIYWPYLYSWASLMAQMVKSLPESWTPRFDPWDGKMPWRRKGMATHSNILDWRIPWTEEPGKLQSMGSQRVRHV